MSDIGDVPHQEDIIAVILEHTAQPVRRYERTEVANMDIAVHSRAAAVNAHTRRVERCKQVFASGQRIIQVNRFCRNRCHEHSSSNVISWYGTMSLPGVWESSHIFLFQTTRIGAPFSANRVSGGSSSDRGRAGGGIFLYRYFLVKCTPIRSQRAEPSKFPLRTPGQAQYCILKLWCFTINLLQRCSGLLATFVVLSIP